MFIAARSLQNTRPYAHRSLLRGCVGQVSSDSNRNPAICYRNPWDEGQCGRSSGRYPAKRQWTDRPAARTTSGSIGAHRLWEAIIQNGCNCRLENISFMRLGETKVCGQRSPRRSGAPDKGQNAMAIFMSAFNPIERRLLEGMP